MTTAFDYAETMTHEEIALRFKKIMGRDMTSDEQRRFLVPKPPKPMDDSNLRDKSTNAF